MSVTINDFGASGGSHSSGVVPDPGSTAGTTKFLREDASWAVPGNSEQFLYDIAANCAVTSGNGWPPSIVQLSGGGNAVLSTPSGSSIDGKVFSVTVAGYASSSSGNCVVQLCLGSSGGLGTLCQVSPNGGQTGSFYAKLLGYWDSTSQSFIYTWISSSTTDPTHWSVSTYSIGATSISTMAGVAFVLKQGDGNGTPSTSSFTVKQFSIEV